MHSGVAFPQRGFTYVPIAKNGSSSILKTIWESDLDHDRHVWCDAIPTSTALVMLRDPTKRAWSAYNMLRTDESMHCEVLDGADREFAWYPSWKFPWDEWLDALAKDRFHSHMSATIIPQSEYLCSPVKYEYIAWDFKAMADRLGLELPRINSAGQKWQQRGEPEGHAPTMPDITPEMQRNLQIIYAADYRIWDLITNK
jgi:hypothetical protein